MRIISLTLMMLLTACILPVRTAPQRDPAVMIDAFFELQVLYYLAFEKHAYIQLDELYNLDNKTTQALRANNIPPEHVPQVKRWHHKLRSYIVFLLTMQPTDDYGVIKTEMSSLLMHQLRTQSPAQIDLSLSNQDFYRRMRDGEVATTDSSKEGVQIFFGDFLRTVLAMNEQAIHKYHNMFAFENSEPVALCRRANYDDCQELEALHSSGTNTKTLTRDTVTKMVNQTIMELNKVIAELQRLEVESIDSHVFQETDFYSTQVSAKYQEYELILIDAAKRGILPIFFTAVFRKMSGNIHPSGYGEWHHANNKLLTEISSYTVTQAVTELKKELIAYWAEIRKAQRHRYSIDEKTIYLWIHSSEIAVARLLLQKPKYAPVVNFLFHHYEHEVQDKRLQKIIKTALTTVGIGTLALFAASFTPILSINAALSKAIIISAAANFGWIALNVSDSVITHNRQLMMERALLSGTSQQISDNLKMLQEFEAARKNAILSSTIGLSMSAGAYNQILKSLSNSSRPFLSTYIRNLFSIKTYTKEQPNIFIDP